MITSCRVKVTIAFDGEKLRDNIWIHLKSATVKDIPVSCDLGRKSMVTDGDSLINESGQTLDYTGGLEATQTTPDGGKYNTAWKTITRGVKYPEKEEDRHTESELSLFFYENMQGIGRDKRQYPELGPDGNPTGNVADNTIQKDDKPCGTYIEVTAFYRSRDMVVSNGDIIYRFMLGKDEKTDYNAERNYHYRLTLQFNGKANDYDWHIDYDEEPGIKVPIPYYYVPYMYNQQMYYPVTIVGEITGELRAEITRSDWGPYNPETESAPSASEYTYYTKKVVNDGPWHGFLSLRQAPMETAENGERTYKAAIGSHTNYLSTYNEEYWNGNGNASLGEKVSHRGIRYYNTDGTPVSEKGSENASDSINDGAYQVSQTIVNGVKHTTFLIPLYSREINLIKTSGFRGNNPYIGYYRYAEITFTATVNGKKQKNIAKILQVPRIVNPKGIYRSYNCVDPFNVHLMKLDHENDPTYTPVKSTGGPWSAEIEFMEGSGWLSVGGKTTVGSKIHGYTDSDIEFDVNFLSKLSNPDDVRCAIIKVLYHNYTCTHRIMVRQGYAPVNLTTGGTKNSKWHVSNLEYVENVSGNLIAHEEESPRGEGSMFKRGNYLTAIASQNNKLENQGKGLATFNLAPYSPADKNPKQSKWGDITSNRNSTLPQAQF